MDNAKHVTQENKLDELCINTIRFLAVDAVEKAASGHPGMPMGDALMAYVLWTKFMRHNPANPLWEGRDRFVLSAGHGSMLLYSLLHLTGYGLTLDDLKEFRQWGSKTPGHPEYDPSIGIETTTGPLGQGFATGVGMAMAQQFLAKRFNRPGFDLFDYNIYAITSDGDLMEGISNEAASIAGHLGLGSIVYLYSDNRITIEGSTDISFTEDVGARFSALGWHVQVADGNDVASIESAIKSAKAERTRPSIIKVRTSIGFGSPNKQDSSSAHGSPLGKDEVKASKQALGWPSEPAFLVPEEAKGHFRRALDNGALMEREWKILLKGYTEAHSELSKELSALDKKEANADYLDNIPLFTPEDGPVATRSASGSVLNAIAPSAPFLIGGSADLAPSNNTYLKGFDDYTRQSPGRNIHFGVREHAMGALLNGLALSRRFIPYGGTFMVFSDYMKPAIRLSALMGLQVVYVLTHDSIGLGEDGPTHQPVEHLAMLRAVPNLTVIRPADAVETACAWKSALQNSTGPTALVLSRQKLAIIDRSKYPVAVKGDASMGAYVVADPEGLEPELILIATGSEVHIALGAYEELSTRGVKARVVSLPSFALFEAQQSEYKLKVLPRKITNRVAIEAGASIGWGRYTGLEGEVISLDRFGASAPGPTNFEKLGFTVDNIVSKCIKMLGLE